MTVAVVCGGFSEEQHSSRKSGLGIAGALETLGHTVFIIEYNADLIGSIKNVSPDVIFPIVQGKHHSDGAAAAIFELIGIPYVGTRPQYAAVINDKILCKKIWRAAGILTPDYFEYNYFEYIKDSFNNFSDKVKSFGFTLPVVVKPPTQGGKFGIVFVRDTATFDALENSFNYDKTLLAEKYIEGRFITQGIVEINGVKTALPPVEVIDTSADEYKVFARETAVSVPHNLPPKQVAELNEITLEAASLVGATGFARLDYHICGDKIHLLEINAAPGLATDYSHISKCAEAAGYEYNDFIGMILATAR